MHFTGQVYRHPAEANTPLLEVTAGCSHNKCSFCTMYRETPFKLSPSNHIEEDLKEMRALRKDVKRIFLVNGEPFILSTDKLVAIAKKIIKYFPEIETITCYTSILSLKNKSIDDLKKLRDLRFNQLHIGLESAYDPALKQMNKGFNKEEAYENIDKLIKAGFEWDALIMTGVAGKGNGEVHIKETAELINKFPPYMISIMTTSVSKGTELEKMRNNGEFIECSELENLEEQKLLLSLLDFEGIDKCHYFGNHNYNLLPIGGKLKNRKEFIRYIDSSISEMDDGLLDGVLKRAAI